MNGNLTYDFVREQNKYIAKVFSWMGIALLVSAFCAFYVGTNPVLFYRVNPFMLLILEMVLVFMLVGMLNKLSPVTATALFIVYSAINGVSLSGVFMMYSGETITSAFITAAAMFGVFAVVGYTTRIDLSKYSSIFFMALIGLMIAGLINIFIGSSFLALGISVVGVVVFAGLTAYDIQTLKEHQRVFGQNHNMAIYGALQLYLDFINIFLYLLRIFGFMNNDD